VENTKTEVVKCPSYRCLWQSYSKMIQNLNVMSSPRQKPSG